VREDQIMRLKQLTSADVREAGGWGDYVVMRMS
jgi:hypothetical protein